MEYFLKEFNKYNFPVYKQEGYRFVSDDYPYLFMTIAFTLVVFSFEILLDFRQLSNFKNAKKISPLLEKHVDDDKFKKSNSYGIDKFNLGIIEQFFMLLVGIMTTCGGFLPYIWDLSNTWCNWFGYFKSSDYDVFFEMKSTIFFMLILTFCDTIIGCFFSYYRNFYVEDKHGFNKLTIYLFFKDKIKYFILSSIFGSPIMAGLVYIVRLGGPSFYYYVWVFLMIVSIIMMTVYPSFIAPLFNKYTKLQNVELFDKIEKLASRVSFPLTEIYEVDGSTRSNHSNAYFYGFFKNKRIVLYDTLIAQVDKDELLAILGHEIGHWKLWHTQQGFVIMQVYTFCLFLTFSFVQNTPGLFAAFGFKYSEDLISSPMPVFIGLVLFSQTFWAPVDKISSLIMNFISRCNEFAADKFACDLGMGDNLASGLIKINTENLGNMVPDPWYSTYHFSHPPVVERLLALKSIDKKKQ